MDTPGKQHQELIAGVKNSEELNALIENADEHISPKFIYDNIKESLKKDKEIIGCFLSKYSDVFHLFDDEIRKDKSFILEWFDKVKQDLRKAEAELEKNPKDQQLIENHKKADLAAANAPHLLAGIHESLINDEDILKAALSIKYVSVIERLNPDLWGMDKDWAVKVAKYNMHSVHYLPRKLKDSVDICKALLDVHLSAFNFFNENMKREKSIQEYALKKDGYVFAIFPEELKRDKEYIKSMLRACYDPNDQRGFMVFSAREPLNRDQELIDLAIERNVGIFLAVYPKDRYSKQLFTHFLKVTPHVYKYVPEDLKGDRDLFISLLCGGFDSSIRENIFKNSDWYNNLEFAIDLMAKTKYVYSYDYLNEELKVNEQVLDIFLKKFPEPHHISLLPAKQLGKEWFRSVVDNNPESVFYIKNKQIASDYLEEVKNMVIDKVKLSDIELYASIASLKGHPLVVRAIMENPLVTDRELDQATIYIEDAELSKPVESLLEHFQKPFFNDRFKQEKDSKGLTYKQKCEQRLEYLAEMSPQDNSLLRIMLSDPCDKIRRLAARKIALTPDEMTVIIQQGVPIVTHYQYGKSIIEKKKDYPVFKGFSENPIISKLDEKVVAELNVFIESDARLKECVFSYRPTFLYLHLCDKVEDIASQQFVAYRESNLNSIGTIEYEIIVDGDEVFQYTIPVDHPEEEDLALEEFEGKILVREIYLYNRQDIPAFIDEDENFEPTSVYDGLACSFAGVRFGMDEFDPSSIDLQKYTPEDEEEEERFFEYYLIKDGKPERLEDY